jgi:hypothetical protein
MEDAVVTSGNPVKNQDNAYRFLQCFGSVHHEFLPKCQNMKQTVYRNESSARSSKFISSETTPQMIFRYLHCAQSQFAIPRGKAQHLRGSASAILARVPALAQAEDRPEATSSRRRGDTNEYDTTVENISKPTVKKWKDR